MDSRFSADELRQFEQRLQEEITKANEALQRSSLETQTVSLEQSIGRISRVDALQRQEMAKAAKLRLKSTVTKAQSAIGRLRSGNFGECLACGEEIDKERLQFSPSAPLCFACQSSRER